MQTQFPAATVAEQFRLAFGNHPAGVAVVTATGSRGPVGITASSLISVSADPAYLAFNIARRSGAAEAILESGTIVVHLLTDRNADVAALFAGSGEERFAKLERWEYLPTGEPLIHGLGVAMRCEIESRVPAGPATVVVASVLGVIGAQSMAAPLVYHRRGYHSIGEHSRLTA
ncbi:flavin reductase family protein [Paeniglutamicibacter psychrophenolicus]|uniref:Flavin reductase (DIM6/NTAB) family NADH-FMN oxidoreductase RutF n=1 Tax=Paeniglutamicibacter psychrophenolicus TaxID=257454 RepID=A0ABS4WGJ0_9MICC|nr:flavin reductase (DIM6/NTAB) family NADH-FMN oxidoreductase RutF [Paeniglutamicibacter psychrophenolicus]